MPNTSRAGAPTGATADRIYAVVAAVAAVFAVIEQPPAWTLACLGVALLAWVPVVLRRSIPLWLFGAVAVLPIVPAVAAHDVGSAIFLTTAAASRVASRSDDRWLVGGLTLVVTALPFVPMLTGHPWNFGAAYFAFGDLFGVLVGVLLRRATRLTAELQAADELLAAAAGREERQRIARDVHDLVAHSLTVVVLQVGGARRVLRVDPDAAEQALVDAERVCRESLDGIRGVVGLLREGDGAEAVSLDVDTLVRTYRDTGLDVELAVRGAIAELPLAPRVALYRVVQEALANAARYAAEGTPTTVSVDCGAASATATVSSTLASRSNGGTSGGYGLIGLREQVEALGGTVSIGQDAERWVVACRLPLHRAGAVTVGDDRR